MVEGWLLVGHSKKKLGILALSKAGSRWSDKFRQKSVSLTLNSTLHCIGLNFIDAFSAPAGVVGGVQVEAKAPTSSDNPARVIPASSQVERGLLFCSRHIEVVELYTSLRLSFGHMPLVLVSSGWLISQTGWLKQRTFYFSQF